MSEEITRYPLTWPVGWPRTGPGKRQNALFADRSVANAVDFVLHEVPLLGGRNVIISSNLQVRMDGLPKSGQRQPVDPGVAVYFSIKNEPRVLACDKWLRVQDNLWAIGKHIQALRGQQRQARQTLSAGKPRREGKNLIFFGYSE